MNRDSMIEKLLVRAGRLVGLASRGDQPFPIPAEPLADQTGSFADQSHATALASEHRDLTYVVGSSSVRVRVYLQKSHDAAPTRPQVTHAEVLLPAIAGSEPQRVMLCNEHWKMVAQVLLRQRPAVKMPLGQPKQPTPTATPDTSAPVEPKVIQIEPPIAEGAGARLYLLEHHRLHDWAQARWKSLPEMEAVCDAFFHNYKVWRLKHPNDWSLADHFFACQKRLNTLRRRAIQAQGESPAEASSSGARNDAPTPSPDSDDECLPYARLLEDVLISWRNRDVLTARAETLRAMLRQGTPMLPSDLRPRRILELIEMRLHAMLMAVSVVLEPGKSLSPRSAPSPGLPPGCPEWPAEAEHGALQALNSDSFFHATGLLKFMGYGVGRKAALSADRRRAILAYVFLGKLPPVNDTHYMQEWGRPKSNRRLRKIANSLAAFARNARRKKSSNWQQAITNWEADLAYLKKRYYDKRARDWKWPETVRRSGR